MRAAARRASRFEGGTNLFGLGRLGVEGGADIAAPHARGQGAPTRAPSSWTIGSRNWLDGTAA